jgi:hypothetical protein
MLLAATLSLAGCVSAQKVDSSFDLKSIGGNEGIIVASMVQDRSGWTSYSNVGFLYRDKDGNNRGRVAYSAGLPGFNVGQRESDIVKVYKLPAGQYEFYDFDMFIGSPVGTTEFSAREEYSIPFTVKPGQVTYIGEIKLIPRTGRNIFGLPIPGGGRFILSDQRSRDMALLRANYPNFAAARVEHRPLRGGNAPPELVSFR